jgi:ABC-type branched-subunit amino acid transport system substrate-binding protein
MKFGSFLLCALCVAVLALSSCAPKKIIRSGGASAPASALPGYRAEDPQKALEKYTRHLETTRPGDPGREEAWRKAVGSAVQLGEYDLAEKNLQAWQAESKNATGSWDWNQAYSQLLLARKGKDAYSAYLIDMVGRTDLDWTTRETAGMELVDHFWNIPEYGLAFDALGLVYKAALDDAARAGLESTALARAESLTTEELQKILDSALGADPNAYPWSMVVWAQSMKLLARDRGNWATVWPSLSAIVRTGGLANRDFFAGNLRTLEQELGVVRQSLVLLLPLSGPYSQVGWKIAKGADTAWRESRAQTAAPAIKLINTESPTFLDELKAVGGVPIVGGPLRKEVWEKIRLSGLHRTARFLTFMPSVEDEGVEAWRFFSSPADQTRALIRWCEQLGVTSYAILHPQDRFGTAMTEVFQEQARILGAHVAVVRGYDIENPPGWSKAVAAILGASGAKDALNPEPPYQAVFLPDSLFRVQQLAPLFHYYEETRLIFLGPQLWSQGLSEINLEAQYYDLTVFPGAWSPELSTQSAQNLKRGMLEGGGEEADLWAALGYDFVRFSALVGGGQSSTEAFNQALAEASTRMPWSLAPMHWDSGRVTQDLFLFQPTRSGMVQADVEKMRQTREARQARREERRAQLEAKKKKEANQ